MIEILKYVFIIILVLFLILGYYKKINRENQDYNRRLMPQDKSSKERREEFNFFNPVGYCKFENGVEPGKTDHGKYFRIISVKNDKV